VCGVGMSMQLEGQLGLCIYGIMLVVVGCWLDALPPTPGVSMLDRFRRTTRQITFRNIPLISLYRVRACVRKRVGRM